MPAQSKDEGGHRKGCPKGIDESAAQGEFGEKTDQREADERAKQKEIQKIKNKSEKDMELERIEAECFFTPGVPTRKYQMPVTPILVYSGVKQPVSLVPSTFSQE